MTETSTKLRRREILWSSVAVGAFSVTGWAYSNIGFIQSFFPLLIGIFALRRILALEMAEGAEGNDLSEQYEIDPDREYTADEQIEVLSEVKGTYGQKGRIWGALTGISAIIAAVAIPLSVALTAVCTAVAGYCLVRYVRIRRIRRTLDTRIETLSRE
ncbi:hypothetical protein [Halomicrococcus sp. NG-SE-24]|uniref:hypothetical protein n=1 Tax=Halomicrococcus sp. NG-SE-24 TaxID=3436928 RepID=UPI003D99252F